MYGAVKSVFSAGGGELPLIVAPYCERMTQARMESLMTVARPAARMTIRASLLEVQRNVHLCVSRND